MQCLKFLKSNQTHLPADQTLQKKKLQGFEDSSMEITQTESEREKGLNKNQQSTRHFQDIKWINTHELQVPDVSTYIALKTECKFWRRIQGTALYIFFGTPCKSMIISKENREEMKVK